MAWTEEEREKRRTGIGASEIAVIAGLSKFAKTPLDVYREKVEGVVTEETKPMKRGRLLEPSVLAWYAEDTGARLATSSTIRHPKIPWLFATPDAIATLPTREIRGVEAKTAGFYAATDFGESGTDEIPHAYAAQVTIAAACAGMDRVDLPVLISGDDFRIFTVDFDPEFFGLLVEAGERFWVDHVLPKRPPVVDYSDPSTAKWIASRFPAEKQRKILRPASEEEALLIDALRDLDSGLAELKRKHKGILEQLKEAIADGAGISAADALSVTWTKNKDGTKTDWKAVAAALGHLHPEEFGALLEAHTKATPGVRVFRKSWARKTKDDNESEG